MIDSPMLSGLAVLLGLAATVVCLYGWRRLRDTTLAAPCAWSAASLAAATGAVIWELALPATPSTPHLDYLAATTSVAPFVALLGAKRPQNRAWQWIVLSLVGLLALQDLRGWSINPAASPSLHTAWRWLLAGIVLAQCVNYLPTRHAPAAAFACAGQASMLAGNLPFLSERSTWSFSAGLGLSSAAVLTAALIVRRTRRTSDGWQDAWLDFRNAYGVLWSLRVAERVNALALEQQCPLRLNWYGVVQAEDADASSAEASAGEHTASLYRILRSVVARFVSAEWLAARGANVAS
ncbi:MAG TPA: hypothetical protein VHC22_10830 [Pirellulales bacterium]|nr:hypothetical protein [Pirellulales bacterium]